MIKNRDYPIHSPLFALVVLNQRTSYLILLCFSNLLDSPRNDLCFPEKLETYKQWMLMLNDREPRPATTNPSTHGDKLLIHFLAGLAV